MSNKYVSHKMWTSAQQLDVGSGGAEFKFNRNSLSYACLKGCAYMQHKSMASYADILINTLRDDYNIPVTVIDTAVPVATALGDMSITDLNDLKVDVADSTKERALASPRSATS